MNSMEIGKEIACDDNKQTNVVLSNFAPWTNKFTVNLITTKVERVTQKQLQIFSSL